MDFLCSELDVILKDNESKIKSLQKKIERLKQMNELVEQIKQDYLEEGV